MKIKAEDFYPLIIKFLSDFIGDKEAKQFTKIVEFEGEVEEDPIVKEGGI